MPTLGVDGTPNADGWTYVNEVVSAQEQAVLTTVGTAVGIYELQVATYDGEFWSPWSTETASVSVPATIRAGSASGDAAAPAPEVGRASVDVLAASGTGDATAPLYQAEHVLETPAATGDASIVTPPPVWTWMDEVISSAQEHVLDTDGWEPQTYQFEVRTFDGEFWSPWSSEKAQFNIPTTVAAPSATGSGDMAPPDNEPDVTAPPMVASAATTTPGFTVEHVLNPPSASGSAQITTPPPIWTWLDEVVSTDESASLITTTSGTFEYQVRTFDGEFWSPWSSEVATFEVEQPIPSAGGVGDMPAPTISVAQLIAPEAMAGQAGATAPITDQPLLVPAMVGTATAEAPGFAQAQTFDVLAASATALMVVPEITPVMTNVYWLISTGWEPVSRRMLDDQGQWFEVSKTAVPTGG